MPTSMKNPAVHLYAAGDAKIEESPYPTIHDPNDVVLKIAYVGVCGSDVHFWTQGGIGARAEAQVKQPLVMGHEASGVVHEVGSAVSSLKQGDRVAIEPGFPCRRCNFCKSGHYNFCSLMAFAACPPTPSGVPQTSGTLAKYFRIPADFCYQLPDSMGLDEGVLVEPLAVAVHVSRLADIKVGGNVVVFGAGTIGLLCAAVAKVMGAARVINIDVNSSRLEFAQSFAATGTFLPPSSASPEEIAQSVKEKFGVPGGFDSVMEATGAEPCIEAGIHVLRSGGSFVQAGLGKAKVSFPITALSEKEIHMKGSFRYGSGDYEMAMFLLESGKVSVKELITHVEDFEGTTAAWERTRKGQGIKTLIKGPVDE